MKNLKRAILLLAVIATSGLLIIYFCNRAIARSATNKLYFDTKSIPFNKVGILLGTSKYLSNGSVNPYYSYRIEAALALIKSGKIKYIIASGDNSRAEYDEPTQMKIDLISGGVDSSLIYLDYAGFRTFDSMVRLKEIFGQDSVTVISQAFHNERAIYIGEREGIATIGYNAHDLPKNSDIRETIREKLARVKVFLDYLSGKRPKYLGPKVTIP